jgi:SAM-dependent methyltransferase
MGLSDWNTTDRTIEKVDQEYDKEKYAALIAWLKQHPNATCEDVKHQEVGNDLAKDFCVSYGDNLYQTTLGNAIEVFDDIVAVTLAPLMEEVDTVLELGCGYGFNLWKLHEKWPDKTYIGGEYSQVGIAIARTVFSQHDNISVEPFNFYDDQYPLFDTVTKDSTALVFTGHALEQLPSAAKPISVLATLGDFIHRCVHFEPVAELHNDSLLGLMRKRYAELNDYNRDLYSCIENHSGIEIVSTDIDVYGRVPFNPTSIITWQPV